MVILLEETRIIVPCLICTNHPSFTASLPLVRASVPFLVIFYDVSFFRHAWAIGLGTLALDPFQFFLVPAVFNPDYTILSLMI